MSVYEPVPVVAGLSDDDRRMFGRLLSVWRNKRPKNLLLSAYADAHRPFKDLGISVPPQLSNVSATIDWPAKAIRALTRKHVFEGFSEGGVIDPFDVNETLDRNGFDLELSQGISSAYRHSFALLSTVKGEASAGDPDVLIRAHDAEFSAGVWDQRRGEIQAAIVITGLSDVGMPDAVTMFTRHATFQLRLEQGQWVSNITDNPTGRVLVEMLVHDPQIGRPFGRSRITREVRYLTDAAIRTLVRGEVSSEFFSSPQRYVLGVDESAFADADKWSAITGRVLAISNNEEGDTPTMGQFPQMTMSPHWEMYRQLAQNFCAATNLPQSAVGIYADNPASAEAMQAAEASLAEDAEYQWRVFRPALKRIQQNILMLRGEYSDVASLPAEAWSVNVNWTAARYVSPQAASDFAVKAVGADPTLAGTDVIRRRLGFTQGEIEEIKSEARRSSVNLLIDQLRGGSDVSGSDNAVTQTGLVEVEGASGS